MSELPNGWTEACLGSFCEIYQPKTIAKSELADDGPYPVYGANGIIGRHHEYNHEASQLLITCRGATCGTVNVSQPRSWITGNAMVVRPQPDCVDLNFAEYFFRGPADYSQIITGSAQPQITRQNLAPVRFPIPPLAEQRRIVAKIDSLSGKSKRARDHLDHIPRLVEKYKQAILAALYADAERHSDQAITLGSISNEVRNGLSKKPSDDQSGLPILRISAVRSLSVRLQDVRYYPTTETVPQTALLRDGDLLFTRYNGNPDFTAVCGMVSGLTRDTTYPDKLIRVRLSQAADPGFVEFVCAAPQSRDWLAPHIKTAAGQHGISGADLKRLPIPLPSVSEQRVVARRIETAFAWIDRLASGTTSARKLVDLLDQAVLAKAFRGDLVPQELNDEPASVLLERIRAERGSPPVGSRARRRKAS